MLEISDKYLKYLEPLGDVRVIGQIVFVAIVLLISWSGVKVIHTNYILQQQISHLQQENEIQKLKNQNQKLKNEYYNSSQYLELSARENFGLAAPGEKELIVPKEVALAYAPQSAATTAADVPAKHQPFFIQNITAWLDFFLHRMPASN